MRRVYYIFIGVIALLSVRCQKEISNSLPRTITPDPVTATVQGNILDEMDNPAPGVQVTIGNKTAITDAKGYFRIRNASLDKNNSVLQAEKTGYFKAFRTFSASNVVNNIAIKLIKRNIAGTVNGATGGEINIGTGSKLRLAANTVSTASGTPYTGSVNVYAAYIDPTASDITRTVPGSFLGSDKNNERVLLKSLGMLAIEMQTTTGEKLQLSPNNTAVLFVEIPATLRATAPETIPLWYLDEQTGLWKEDGTATRNGNVYEGLVRHFTYWNCDVPGPSVNLTATFVNEAGLPLVYTEVRIFPAGSLYSAHGFTDSIGMIHGPVPANVPLILNVLDPCYGVAYSQNIGPFSSNVNLGTITVNNPLSSVTVQGRLVNCAGTPVTNGFAVIEFNNTLRYASVSATGLFSTSFITCYSTPANCQVTGVDSLNGQQSATVTLPVTAPITNTGDITTCGTSTIEFMDYTVDAASFSISSLNASDQFFSRDSIAPPHFISLTAYRNPSVNLSFNHTNTNSTGTFNIDYLNVNAYGNGTPVTPCTVTLTSYAQTIGQYYEGSVSGQFKDAANNIHSLNGTFRIRRR